METPHELNPNSRGPSILERGGVGVPVPPLLDPESTPSSEAGSGSSVAVASVSFPVPSFGRIRIEDVVGGGLRAVTVDRPVERQHEIQVVVEVRVPERDAHAAEVLREGRLISVLPRDEVRSRSVR